MEILGQVSVEINSSKGYSYDHDDAESSWDPPSATAIGPVVRRWTDSVD